MNTSTKTAAIYTSSRILEDYIAQGAEIKTIKGRQWIWFGPVHADFIDEVPLPAWDIAWKFGVVEFLDDSREWRWGFPVEILA